MSQEAEYLGKGRKIKLSECKRRYAAKIKISYDLAMNLFHHPLFEGMQTSFETSWDGYIDGLKRKGFVIEDDTKAEVIKMIADHLSIEEVKEVEQFISYLKNGGMEELKYNKQGLEQQAPAICSNCNNEGGRRPGMACAACGKMNNA